LRLSQLINTPVLWKIKIMKNSLLLLAFILVFGSCTQNEEVLDRIEKKWTLERTEGNSQGIEISSQWQKMQIKNNEFTLLIDEITDEKVIESEVAKGRIEVCDDMMLHNCYKFIVESKDLDKHFMFEIVEEKIITYQNNELTFTGICCNELSYFLK